MRKLTGAFFGFVLLQAVLRLSTPYPDIPGTSATSGYGLRIEPYRGVRLLSHPGSRLGFGSLIRMAPDHKVAVILLTNNSGGTLNKTAEKAFALMPPLKRDNAKHCISKIR